MGNAISYWKDEIFGVIHEEMPKFELLEKTDHFEIRQYGPAIVAETTYKGTQGSGKSTSTAFWALASYIGAVSAPKNIKPSSPGGEQDKEPSAEPIAMTAPVIMEEKPEAIAMTAPVIIEEKPEPIAMTAPVIMEERPSDATQANRSTGVDMSEADLVSRAMKSYMELTDWSSKEQETTMAMQFVLPSKYTMETVPKPTDPRVVVKEVPGKMVGVVTFSGQWVESSYKEKADKLKADLEAAGHKPKGPYKFAGYNSPMALPWYRRNEIWYELEA